MAIDSDTTELAEQIKNSNAQKPVSTTLDTNRRIIRRVTDGIYREPWAAFRELISNAYDADATLVRITTDWPRFKEIQIHDNGNGMSEEVLAYLIKNIGGSAKRTKDGAEMGIAQSQNTGISPEGRELIGKIGIGLFAVNHLTQHFQIITKIKGNKHRTLASILMKTYQEDIDEVSVEAGQVKIWQEQSSNEGQHGTTIILRDIRPEIVNSMKSLSRWRALEDGDETLGKLNHASLPFPEFHIGNFSDNNNSGELLPCLPWTDDIKNPLEKFESFFRSLAEKARNDKRPDLMVLDNYFQMLWKLSLSCPVQYIEKHPFKIDGNSTYHIYQLKNARRQKSELIDLPTEKTVKEYFELNTLTEDVLGGFKVLFDDIELRRPINLLQENTRPTSRIKLPLLFVGRHKAPWNNEQQKRGGGSLNFEGYLYWNSGIFPKENNGVLINVRGASGILFDSTFMNYQTSELNRLKQITAEIYVLDGLEAALNADRESFNFSHPHYLFLRDWLHNAIRQLTSIHKALGAESLQKERRKIARDAEAKRRETLQTIWEKTKGKTEDPYHLDFGEDSQDTSENELTAAALTKAISLPEKINDHDIVWPEGFDGMTANVPNVESLVIVLEAYDLLEQLTPELRGELIRDLLSALGDSDG